MSARGNFAPVLWSTNTAWYLYSIWPGRYLNSTKCSWTIKYNTVQYGTVQCSILQYNTIQHNAVRRSTIQYNTIQRNTTDNTIQYKAIQSIWCEWMPERYGQSFLGKSSLTVNTYDQTNEIVRSVHSPSFIRNKSLLTVNLKVILRQSFIRVTFNLTI